MFKVIKHNHKWTVVNSDTKKVVDSFHRRLDAEGLAMILNQPLPDDVLNRPIEVEELDLTSVPVDLEI